MRQETGGTGLMLAGWLLAGLAKAALAGLLLRRVEWALVALTAPGGD
jgi:hypothetical protein